MKNLLLTLVLLLSSFVLGLSQVGINPDNSEPDPSAMLDVKSTDKGLLLPRLTTEERDAIADPADGLLIYNTDDNCFNYYASGAWYKDCGRSLTADPEPTASAVAGSSNSDVANGIAVDSDGNTFVVGSHQDNFVLGNSTFTATGTDHILVKLDADQNVLWSWKVDDVSLYDVETDAAGNAYVIGTASSGVTIDNTTFSAPAAFVIKFDTNGNIVWLSHGTADNIGVDDMELAPDETIAIGGFFNGALSWGSISETGNSVSGDYFVLKLDTNGDPLWANVSSSDSYAYIYGLSVGTDGSVAIGLDMDGTTTIGTETFTTAADAYDGAVVKYNSDGSFAWVSRLESSNYKSVYGTHTDDAGNVYITGEICETLTLDGLTLTISDDVCRAYLIKLDAFGNVVWGNLFETTESAFGWRIVELNNGDIAVTGGYNGDFSFDGVTYSANSNDIFVLTYSPDGNPIWFALLTGDNFDGANDLEFGNGLLHLAGFFNSNIQIGDQTFTSTGSNDWFIATLTADGAFESYQNSLDNSQDADTDATNELQGLSISGTQLTISNGNAVDLSSIDTDKQGIDQLSLNNNTLQISLENDGVNPYELDLSGVGTDDQKIEGFYLNNNDLTIFLEGDDDSPYRVDISPINTDDQVVDLFEFDGAFLSLSLENDNQGPKVVNLSSINTDNQNIDQFFLNGTNLNLSIENDGVNNHIVDLSSLKTTLSESEVDAFVSNNGYQLATDDGDTDDTNEIELPAGGAEGQTIVQDASGNLFWEKNLQTVDEFTLTDDVLSLSLENDGTDALTVDLSALSKTMLEDTDGDTKIQVEETTDEDIIRFDVAGTEAMIIDQNGQVGIGLTPSNQLSVRMGLATSTTESAAHTSGNQAFDDPGSTWQSFTATVSGQLSSVELEMRNVNADKTLSIYQGMGTSGTLLGMVTITAVTSGDGWVVFDFSSENITQVAGEIYTISIDDRDSWKVSQTGNYAGGEALSDPAWDLNFRVNAASYSTGFQVSESGVTINDYTLPTTDGTDGQVLTTDGMGNVSWQDIPSAANNISGSSDLLIRMQQLEQENARLKEENQQIKALLSQIQTRLEALAAETNNN